MSKRTKHNRNKNKKFNNRSKRLYGGAQLEHGATNYVTPVPKSLVTPVPQNEVKPPGIFDVIGDKLATFSGNVAGYVENKGLRLLGLKKIKDGEPIKNDTVTAVDDKISKISDSATNAVSGIAAQATAIGADIVKVADGTSAAILENVNDVLESPKVERSVVETAKQSAKDAVNLLNKVNVALDTPELKAATEDALDNVADYAAVAVEAMDKPIDKAIDKFNEAGSEAAAGVASGLVKVATDAAAAVPGVGAIIDIGKMVNDGTAAVGKVVESASSTVEAVSDAVEETSENFKEGIDKLKRAENAVAEKIDMKTAVLGNSSTDVLRNSSTDVLGKGANSLNKLNKQGLDTLNRVNSSMEEFQNPLKNNVAAAAAGGGRKTRRKLFKRKAKSKRVRFAI
jgi:uncharacterized phage infection (PIP) family protein YhgE